MSLVFHFYFIWWCRDTKLLYPDNLKERNIYALSCSWYFSLQNIHALGCIWYFSFLYVKSLSLQYPWHVLVKSSFHMGYNCTSLGSSKHTISREPRLIHPTQTAMWLAETHDQSNKHRIGGHTHTRMHMWRTHLIGWYQSNYGPTLHINKIFWSYCTHWSLHIMSGALHVSSTCTPSVELAHMISEAHDQSRQNPWW